MSNITTDELSLYDRQIRLWGFDAQKRILTARVLFIGVNQLIMESAKNLVLGGLGKISLIDSNIVKDSDLQELYILDSSAIGLKKDIAMSKALSGFNPTISIITDEIGSTLDISFMASFDIVVATNLSIDKQIELNEICRLSKTKFVSSNMLGLYGFIFCDLIEHHYVLETKEKNVLNPDEIITKNQEFKEIHCPLKTSITHKFESMSKRKLNRLVSPLYFILLAYNKIIENSKLSIDSQELFALLQKEVNDLLVSNNVSDDFVTESAIRDFIANSSNNVTAATSILGGILAQEIIKIVSGKNLPISNWLIFNALESDALIHNIK
ncbi:hypothetical protein BB561_003200 [Smittium simulii]|uniref:Ubiquitin-like 1-activating enzyme E1A n=1 Tax=Smittium simulii TaxID=133385 RepID=A0A2T9YMJ7_9FUNG|nr:hypothetical protein BB561_003200 [Smittium simulii]